MHRTVAIISFALPGVIGFILRIRGIREIQGWLFSCTVIPILILVDEFLLPYRGGGASMWPIALAFGSFYGAMSGGLGVVLASFYLKKKRGSE